MLYPSFLVLILNKLVGDFNVNYLSDARNDLLLFMTDRNYQQVVSEPTTDYGSLLDHIYINTPHSLHSCYVADVYFSDHMMLFFVH